jgi:hypothetical protein
MVGLTTEQDWKQKALLVIQGKVDDCVFIRIHRNLLLPGFGIREYRVPNLALGQNVESSFLTLELSALVPGHDLILARRRISQFEFSIFIGYGVIGMGHHHNFRVHPGVTAVTSYVDQTCSRYVILTGRLVKGKGKL